MPHLFSFPTTCPSSFCPFPCLVIPIFLPPFRVPFTLSIACHPPLSPFLLYPFSVSLFLVYPLCLFPSLLVCLQLSLTPRFLLSHLCFSIFHPFLLVFPSTVNSQSYNYYYYYYYYYYFYYYLMCVSAEGIPVSLCVCGCVGVKAWVWYE